MLEIVKLQLKQYHAAIKDYDKTIELDPKYADAYYNRGEAKASLNQHAAATRDYQTALRLARQANNKDLKAKILENLELLEKLEKLK